MRKPELTGLLGLGLAALAVPAYLAYRREMDAAFARAASGCQTLEAACGPIEYAESGSGAPVLCIHGTGGGFDQGLLFSRQMGLDPARYRSIAPSRFGYLGTPMPDGQTSPAAEADAHAGLLDALGIAEPIVVAGASAGALSAMQFALRYPQRTKALILMVPDSWANRNDAAAGRQQIGNNQFIMEVALRSDLVFWTALKLARSEMLGFIGVPKELQQNLSEYDEQNLKETLEGILPVSRRWRGIIKDNANHAALQRYPVEEISAPTLIIDAEDVVTFRGSSLLAADIPDARFLAFETGGHLLVGRSAAVVSAVDEFLCEVAAEQA